MDAELIFWTIAGGLGLLGLILMVFVGRNTPDDDYCGICIPEKNVDDMEDRGN